MLKNPTIEDKDGQTFILDDSGQIWKAFNETVPHSRARELVDVYNWGFREGIETVKTEAAPQTSKV